LPLPSTSSSISILSQVGKHTWKDTNRSETSEIATDTTYNIALTSLSVETQQLNQSCIVLYVTASSFVKKEKKKKKKRNTTKAVVQTLLTNIQSEN
jgi:hypothetical protein